MGRKVVGGRKINGGEGSKEGRKISRVRKK
jgi:hypothetical protein